MSQLLSLFRAITSESSRSVQPTSELRGLGRDEAKALAASIKKMDEDPRMKDAMAELELRSILPEGFRNRKSSEIRLAKGEEGKLVLTSSGIRINTNGTTVRYYPSDERITPSPRNLLRYGIEAADWKAILENFLTHEVRADATQILETYKAKTQTFHANLDQLKKNSAIVQETMEELREAGKGAAINIEYNHRKPGYPVLVLTAQGFRTKLRGGLSPVKPTDIEGMDNLPDVEGYFRSYKEIKQLTERLIEEGAFEKKRIANSPFRGALIYTAVVPDSSERIELIESYGPQHHDFRLRVFDSTNEREVFLWTSSPFVEKALQRISSRVS